jgi:hypothetical protein
MIHRGKLIIILVGALVATRPASGQITVAAVIQAGIKKVIRALDLRIQRQQIQSLEMQTVEKKMETSMVAHKLAAISQWIDKQRRLYQQYYRELWQVKSALRDGGALRGILAQEKLLVKAYADGWPGLRHCGQFSAQELDHLAELYTAILQDNSRQMAALTMLIEDFRIQMPDAMRLEIMRRIARRITSDVNDLLRLTRENQVLALQRAREKNDIGVLGALYGHPGVHRTKSSLP